MKTTLVLIVVGLGTMSGLNVWAQAQDSDFPDQGQQNQCVLAEPAAPSSGEIYRRPSKCGAEGQQGFMGGQDGKPVNGKLYRVVDGDTVHVEVGDEIYAVRMVGIDTPESHFEGKQAPYWGKVASDELKSILKKGDAVTIVFERDSRCDSYGRFLGHIFKGKMNVNKEMLVCGLAVNYCIAPSLDFCKEYAEAVRPAFEQKKGIFSDPCMVTPYVWRKRVSGKPYTRVVENEKTHYVFPGNYYYLVPMPDRVFYGQASQVPPGRIFVEL